MNTDDLEGDLDLLALAYVNAELDAAAADGFEARLAHDQAAREAVGRAVLIGSAVVRELETTGTASRFFGWRPVSPLFGAALAAAALVVAGVCFGVYFARDLPVSDRDLVASDAEAQELIASWVELADLEEESEVGFDEDDVDADLAAPGWLVQAVEADKDKE